MIQGNERTSKPAPKLYTGVGEFNVLGFNFTREQIIAKCGYDPGTEQVYIKDNRDGGKQTIVRAFLKNVETDNTYSLTFFMEKKEIESRAGNKQYVNSKCKALYPGTNGLPEWFTKFDYRAAYVGEKELLDFIRKWLNNNYDWYNDDVVQYPLKDNLTIIDGNVAPLNDLAKRFANSTVGVEMGVRETDKGLRQDLCNKCFLPSWIIQKGTLNGIPMNTSESERIRLGLPSDLKEFLKTIEGDYGYKNPHGNSYKFMEYDPSVNVVMGTNSAIITNTQEHTDDDLAY